MLGVDTVVVDFQADGILGMSPSASGNEELLADKLFGCSVLRNFANWYSRTIHGFYLRYRVNLFMGSFDKLYFMHVCR